MPKNKKKNKNLLLIVTAILIISLIFIYGQFFVVSSLDDYTFLTDTNNPINCAIPTVTSCTGGSLHGHQTNNCEFPRWTAQTDIEFSRGCEPCPGCTTTDFGHSEITGTELSIKLSGTKSYAEIQTKDSFYGKKFRTTINAKRGRFKISLTSPSTGKTVVLFETEIQIETCCSPERITKSFPEEAAFEFFPDFLDNNMINVLWKGLNVTRVNIAGFNKSDTQIVIRASGSRLTGFDVTIDSPRFKEEYNCRIEDDEVVVADKFVGPGVVNRSSLTYTPLHFCKDNYPARFSRVIYCYVNQGFVSYVIVTNKLWFGACEG